MLGLREDCCRKRRNRFELFRKAVCYPHKERSRHTRLDLQEKLSEGHQPYCPLKGGSKHRPCTLISSVFKVKTGVNIWQWTCNEDRGGEKRNEGSIKQNRTR